MYPPKHHVEDEREKIYRVIEAFRFATLISKTEDDVIITQLPLILERDKGKYGRLVGHIDKNNPHVKYLNNQNISIIFHGPNTYISPTIFQSDYLPTWNSVSVHVKGTVKITESAKEVRDSIITMTTILENSDNPFILTKDNAKMSSLLNYIKGFSIDIKDIVGRFKLSQDRNLNDMAIAKQQIIASSKNDCEEIINFIL